MAFTNIKRTFIICLTLITVIFGMGGALVLKSWLPEQYPAAYPCISIFFYLYGLLFIFIYGLFPNKRLEIQILGKGIKLLFGLLFVVAYAQIVGLQVKAFILLFLCYYFIYLIFESAFFMKYEMEVKKGLKR